MRNLVLIMIGSLFYKFDKLKKQLIRSYLQHYYEKKIGKIGKGVIFGGVCKLTGLENIEIEDNVIIGDNAFIRGEGGLFIGANCHFSRNLLIYTHNHNYEGVVLPYDNTFRYRKVVIEKNVWVGMNVTILPGAHIGEGAIIGAGSVISGKIDKLTIVGASTAQIIKYRNKEHYEKLEKEKKYGGPNGIPLES